MRPVNENASYKTCKLLEYLQSVAGKKIVTGQHTQTNAMEEIDYIRNLTGREPKLRGFELLSYSPNINYNEMGKECLTEIEENRDTVETALSWAQNSDGIITFTFHWFSPIGGRDKSFYTENTDYDARKVLCDGTAERKAFFSDLDAIADILKRFRDLDIPVLWRPFHESEGTWFWWGEYGPEVAGELYKLLY
ncbi:MAG: glycosyl hydrolase, partial [Coprococcus sp.]